MKAFKDTNLGFTERINNGFEGATDPIGVGNPANNTAIDGWYLAGTGSRDWYNSGVQFLASGQTTDSRTGNYHYYSPTGATNDNYGIFQSVTAGKSFRVQYYMSYYNADVSNDGATNTTWFCFDDGDESNNIYNDAGASVDPMPNGQYSSNFVMGQVTLQYINASNSMQMTIVIRNRNNGGSVTERINLNISDLVSFPTPVLETTRHYGIRFDFTETGASLYLDVANNGFWYHIKSLAVDKWVNVNLDRFAMLLFSDDGFPNDESSIDDVVVSSITISSENELTFRDLTGATTLGCGGSASLTIIDQDHLEKATVLAYIGSDLVITDNNFVKVIFRGIILDPITITREGYKIIAMEKGKILKHYLASVNPVIYSDNIEIINSGTLTDQDVDFSAIDLVDKAIIITKPDPKKVISYPYAEAFIVIGSGVDYLNPAFYTVYAPHDHNFGGSPNTEHGSILNLHRELPTTWDGDTPAIIDYLYGAYDKGVLGAQDTDGFCIELKFKIYLKENTVVDTMKVKTKYCIGQNSGRNLFGLYDNVADTYDVIKDPDESSWYNMTPSIKYPIGGDNANEPSKAWKTFEIDIDSADITDYMDSVGVVNSYGYQEYETILRISVDAITFNWSAALLFIDTCSIELTTDIDQTQTLGESVGATRADNAFTIDNTILPTDGTGSGDIYDITDTISEILASAWSASGIDTIFNLDQTDLSDGQKGDNTDLTNTDLLTLLEKYSNVFGFPFWQEDDKIKISNSFDSSSITLTEDDVYLFMDNFILYQADGSLLRTKMVVQGSNFATASTGAGGITALAPAVSTGLTEYYINQDLTSPALLATFIASNRSKHENIQYRIGGIHLNYNRTDRNYSSLTLGTRVGLTLGTAGALANFTLDGTGDGYLYVKEIHFASDGINDFINPILESEIIGDV